MNNWDWTNQEALNLYSQYLGKLEVVNPGQSILNSYGARALTLKTLNLPQDKDIIVNLSAFENMLKNPNRSISARPESGTYSDMSGVVPPPQLKMHELQSASLTDKSERDSLMLLGYVSPTRLNQIGQVGQPPTPPPTASVPSASMWGGIQSWLPYIGIGVLTVGGVWLWSSSSQREAERKKLARYAQEKKSIEALFDKGLGTFAKLESIDLPNGSDGVIFYSQRANADIGRIPMTIIYGDDTYQLKLLTK